jgi:hypothetical protein
MCTLPVCPADLDYRLFESLRCSSIAATFNRRTNRVSKISYTSLATNSNFIYSFLFWPGYTELQPPPDSWGAHAGGDIGLKVTEPLKFGFWNGNTIGSRHAVALEKDLQG